MNQTTTLLPGRIYHLYDRGRNRERTFYEPRNYDHFLSLWAKHIEPIAETYAYCLLPNHFHFLVRIREPHAIPGENAPNHDYPELITDNYQQRIHESFSDFFTAYTKDFNTQYDRTGQLFQESLKRKEVTNDHDLNRLILYIHANPQRHGLTDDFREWKYSSYHSLLAEKVTQLRGDLIQERFGDKAQFLEFHRWKEEFHGEGWERWEG